MGSQVRQSLEVKQLNNGDCRRRVQGPLPPVSEKEHGKLSRREQATGEQASSEQASSERATGATPREATGIPFSVEI